MENQLGDIKDRIVRGAPSIARAFLLLLAIGFAAFCVFYNLTPDRILFTNDMAVSVAVAKLMQAGEMPLAGPPSHLGGRSLGAAFYWFVAVCFGIGKGDVYRGVLIGTGLELLALVSIAGVFRLVAKKGAFTAGVIGYLCCLAAGSALWLLRVPWHNNYLVLPASFSFLAALYVIFYGRSYLPFLFLSTSILAQSSLTSIPMAAGLWIAVLVGLFLKKKQESSTRIERLAALPSIQILFVLLSIVSWLLVLLYAAFVSPLLSEILSKTVKNPKPRGGIIGALQAMTEEVQTIVVGAVPGFGEFDFVRLALFFLLLVGAIFFLARMWRRSENARWVIGSASGVMFLYFCAFCVLRKPLHSYYMNPMIFVPCILIGLSVASAWEDIVSERSFFRYSSVCFLLLFFGLAGVSIAHNVEAAADRPFDDHSTLAHAIEFSSIIQRIGGEDGSYRLFATDAHEIRGTRENAYYLFMKKPPYGLMQYHASFRELPTFKIPYDTERGYLLACPYPDELRRAKLWRRVLSKWVEVQKISVPECTTCSGCELVELRRRTDR